MIKEKNIELVRRGGIDVAWPSKKNLYRFNIRSVFLALSLPIVLLSVTTYASEPLKIGINPWPGYEFFFLAQEKGFFKNLGLDLKLVEFASLTDASNAYQRKQVDGLATTGVDLYFAHKRNPRREMQVVLVTDYSNGADQIIGRIGRSKTKSLKGLKIASEPNSLGMYFLRRILEKQHLGIEDVTVVMMDQSKMREAMERNEIDLAVTYPPVSIELAKLFRTEVLFTSADIPGEVIDVIAVKRQWVEENRAKVPLFAKGFYQAIQFAKTNPIEATNMMAKREGISSDDFVEALKGIRIADEEEWKKTFSDGKVLHSAAQNIARIFAKAKHSERVPWNIDVIFDPILREQRTSAP